MDRHGISCSVSNLLACLSTLTVWPLEHRGGELVVGGGSLLESKAQNLPWSLQSPTVATHLSVLVELKGAFLAEMAHPVPLECIFLL